MNHLFQRWSVPAILSDASQLARLGDAARRVLESQRAIPPPGCKSDVDVSEFIDLLSQSGLADGVALSDLAERVAIHSGKSEQPAVLDVCAYLIKHHDLTSWQCNKLLNRQYKGFSLGAYTLCDQLSASRTHGVYRARHKVLRRHAAIVVFPPYPTAPARDVLMHAVPVLESLHAPVALELIDAGLSSGIAYIVREYVAGSDLASLISSDGPMQIADAAFVTAQFASLLSAAKPPSLRGSPIPLSNIVMDVHGLINIISPLSDVLAPMPTSLRLRASEVSSSGREDADNIIAILVELITGDVVEPRVRTRRCDLGFVLDVLPVDLREALESALQTANTAGGGASSAICKSLTSWLMHAR